MPYILNKTNGSTIAIVQDASIDLTTDLTFVGKNYAGYGEYQNENFLRLLENFASGTPTSRPIEGQLWFDNINKKVNFYDGLNWKGLATLEINDSNPVTSKNFLAGDLWYDRPASQLYVYNGSEFVLIGPLTGDDTKAGWKGSREYSSLEGLDTPKYNLKAVIGARNEVIALVSSESYTVIQGSQSYPVYGLQGVIKKGITLVGSDPVVGSSEAAGAYFWGSASHSLKSNTSTNAERVVYILNTTTNRDFSIPFMNTSTSTTSSLPFYDTGFTFNPATKTLRTSIFNGVATSAYYADLAERYETDNEYDVGTVVVIGGEKEITVTHTHADTAVAGVISHHPGYMMNSDAGTDKTHPYVALRGRVPCKVIGPVKKGALLVTSSYPGFAEVMLSSDNHNALVGKALEDFSGLKGMIEILV
jgi:hypothetical protein